MTVRVWIGTTVAGLSEAWTSKLLPPGPCFSVTPGLVEWFADSDDEEREWAALTLAARSVLGLLTSEHDLVRVVVTAEVPDSDVGSADSAGNGSVVVSAPVPLSRWKAVHVDEPSSGPVVSRAAAAYAVAMDDDHPDVEAAMAVVEEADDLDLLWHTVAEVPSLVG